VPEGGLDRDGQVERSPDVLVGTAVARDGSKEEP
jgi:hypothetical protein